MPNLHKKDTVVASAQSKCTYIVRCPSVGNSTESHVQGSSVSENLSLKMGVLPQHISNTKHFGFQFQDQDSSSTQSTGQSYPKVTRIGDSDTYKQSILSASSGNDETHEKLSGVHNKLISSIGLGTQEFVMCPTQIGHTQSIAHIPLHFAEPYVGGVVSSAYGTQSMLHNPHMMAMFPARVPLPVNLAEDEPIYVNSKQYRAILRRRQNRAKLEAQNKLVKVRKPYLHVSRHLHALNRARGSGGRFLNTNKSDESKLTSSSNGADISNSALPHLTGNMLRSEMHHREYYQEAASNTSCSDVTSTSNSNMFQHQGFGFSSYSSHIGGTLESPSENMHAGDHLHHRSGTR